MTLRLASILLAVAALFLSACEHRGDTPEELQRYVAEHVRVEDGQVLIYTTLNQPLLPGELSDNCHEKEFEIKAGAAPFTLRRLEISEQDGATGITDLYQVRVPSQRMRQRSRFKGAWGEWREWAAYPEAVFQVAMREGKCFFR